MPRVAWSFIIAVILLGCSEQPIPAHVSIDERCLDLNSTACETPIDLHRKPKRKSKDNLKFSGAKKRLRTGRRKINALER